MLCLKPPSVRYSSVQWAGVFLNQRAGAWLIVIRRDYHRKHTGVLARSSDYDNIDISNNKQHEYQQGCDQNVT